ncbi:MAG: TonB-dependent receptor, partial [Candidatus Omnitrophica bacterium]|nr:TonB-dependent receptor [Candidatus Omnitrophota bacterium]
DVTFKIQAVGLEHALVPGIEISRETDVSYNRVKTGADSASTSLYDPNTDDPYLENIQRDGSRNETAANSVALYAFDTAKINDQWEVTGGLRWDYFNVDYSSIATNGAVTTDLGRIDRTLSWRSGLVFKPQETGSIYLAYGTAFNPSAEGLALSTTATATNNFAVDPEESRTYELGTKWDLAEERLAFNAAIFRTDKTNARTEDTNNPNDIIALEGKQHVQGLELGLTGHLTERWNAFMGYTLLLSEITKSANASEVGNELSNTPQNTFSLWNVYALPANFEIGGGLQFVGDRYSSNANNRRAPNYLTGDLMAAYKVNKNMTMRLNIYNVGDLEYIATVGGGHFIPGAGRSATLTTEFKF